MTGYWVVFPLMSQLNYAWVRAVASWVEITMTYDPPDGALLYGDLHTAIVPDAGVRVNLPPQRRGGEEPERRAERTAGARAAGHEFLDCGPNEPRPSGRG